MFLWKALMLAARELFDVEVPKVHSIFSCDCESSRRDFIREQFPETSIIIEDAKSFPDMQNTGGVLTSFRNTITGTSTRLPKTKLYGSGFSCKSVSNQNKNRISSFYANTHQQAKANKHKSKSNIHPGVRTSLVWRTPQGRQVRLSSTASA